MKSVEAALLERGGAPSRKRPAYLVPPTHLSQSKRVKTGSSSSNPLTSDSTDNRVAGRKKAELWFNQSNDSGAQKQDIPFVDNDPPFYFKRNDSDESSIQAHRSDASMHSAQGKIGPTAPTASLLAQMNARDNDNDSDDFRSVIDDLTIQNKKLRKKLKKYERLHCSHLQKEKLFEVRIHGLAAHRRRQLEDTLRSFASSIDEDESHGSAPRHHHHHHYVTAKSSAPQLGVAAASSYHHRHPDGKPSSSSSGSRPLVDSAYASMSGTGSLPNLTAAAAKDSNNPNGSGSSAQQNVKSFLHEIPEALMPKSIIPMSDKSRSKLVVRRLEQLFTGRGAPAQRHAQSHQQQEVSTAAAEAERSKIEACGKRVWREGTREAHILPSGTDLKMDVMDDAPTSANNTHRSDSSEGVLDASGGSGAAARPAGVTAPATTTQQTSALQQPRKRSQSPEQRPTRPLDLDLYRAQVPADNIEYIRHLGLASPTAGGRPSAPGSGENSDDGWVYLNLLTSMAQLHTLNVTPDFVRKALTEVASTLRLSSDGTKVKWLGNAAEGTRQSSDGDESDQQPTAQAQWKSSEDASLSASKRGSFTEASSSKDDSGNLAAAAAAAAATPAPLDTGDTTRTPTAAKRRLVNVETSSPTDTFHYKPLFYHAENSEDDDESGVGSLDESDDSLDFDTGMHSSSAAIAERQARLRPRNRDNGPIIFYNRAKFCTDLGGDAGGDEAAYEPVAYDRCTQQPIGSSRGSEEPTSQVLSCDPAPSCAAISEREGHGSSPDMPRARPAQGGTTTRPSRRREISQYRAHSHRHRAYLHSEPSALDDAASSTTSNVEKQSRTSALDMEDLITSISSCAASPARPPAPIELEASGLGGVQPGDNFVVQVQTRHGRPASTSPVRGTRAGARVRKAAHSHRLHNLAGRHAGAGAGADEMHTDDNDNDLTSKEADSVAATAQVISAVRMPLEPSQLPPPSFICLPFTSSESENGGPDDLETTLDSSRGESAGVAGDRADDGGGAGPRRMYDGTTPALRRGLGRDDRSRVIRSFVGARNSSSADQLANNGTGSRGSADASNDTENKESSYNTSHEENEAPRHTALHPLHSRASPHAQRAPHMPQAAADLAASRRLVPRHQLYAPYLQHDHNLRSQHAEVHTSSASDTGRSRRRRQRHRARGSGASSSSSSSSCSSSSSSSIDLLAHARMQDPHAVQLLQREWERNNHITTTDATTSSSSSSNSSSRSAKPGSPTASAEHSNDDNAQAKPPRRSERNTAPTPLKEGQGQVDQGRRRSGRLAIKASNASPSTRAVPTSAAALSEQAVVSEPASDSDVGDAAGQAGTLAVVQTRAPAPGKGTLPRATRAKAVSPRASRSGSRALSAKGKGQGKGKAGLAAAGGAGADGANIEEEEEGAGESDVDSMSVDRDESVA